MANCYVSNFFTNLLSTESLFLQDTAIYEDFMNYERAKLYTNMAATFYKIHEIGSNPRNDLQTALGRFGKTTLQPPFYLPLVVINIVC